jgi:hypothetical protein
MFLKWMRIIFLALAKDIFRFIAWCRKKKITDTDRSRIILTILGIISLFSGAKSRVGYTNLHDEGLYRGNLVNKTVRYNPHVHIAVNFVSLVNKALGLFDNAYADCSCSSA